MKLLFFSLKKIYRTDVVKVSFWSGLSTGVRMVTGFVSIKVISNLIGPSGIAMVGQFLNSISMVSMISTGGIGQGVTKLIAENYDDAEKQKLIIANSFKVTLLFTALVSVVVIGLSSQIAQSIFKNTEYHSLIIFLGLSIVLYSVNTLLISILNGFKEFKKFVLINIISSLASLVLTVVLVLNFRLYGALINCIASQSIAIIVSLIFLRREVWFSDLIAKVPLNLAILKSLGGFTLMALTSAVLTPLTQLLIRSFISGRLSIDNAGIWEGMNRLSNMYLMLITTSISIYYLPKLAELKDSYPLKKEIFKTAKIILPALVVGFISIYFMRHVLIVTLFSNQFVAMEALFPFQLLGDFFKIASFLLAFLFWAKGMTRLYILTEIIFGSILVLSVMSGVKWEGLVGSAYGYAFTYFLYFLTSVYIFRKLLLTKPLPLG